jgi:putative endonuclease
MARAVGSRLLLRTTDRSSSLWFHVKRIDWRARNQLPPSQPARRIDVRTASTLPHENRGDDVNVDVMAYMYILQCVDGTYYVGGAWHLLKRVEQRNAGLGSRDTRSRLPVALVYPVEYTSIAEAFGREKQVQSGSRGKRGALVDGLPEDLPGIVRLHKRRSPEPVSDRADPSPP